MPINDIVDQLYTSETTGIYPGPMSNSQGLRPWEEGYVDMATTLVTQAIVGQLVVKQIAAINTGGGNALLSAIANQVLLNREYGVVTKAALSLANPTGVMQQGGTCLAFCTTTGTAIAVGTLLSADGAGNLTVAPTTPTPGQILARSYGILAGSTSTPTLVLVQVGIA
jgi:hypothetical protein